ncbi:MAG TPA: methyltransferase domain-containing protein [Solirubrobacteraceae bacterium]
MLAGSRRRILERLPDTALVLDVGGWARPFPRADWVLDLMPHATRGMLGSDGPGPERFSERTWVERDICAREPWPFADGQFDFAICSHTLEDVRDPVHVCQELQRVARAGYVEVPSRLEEQAYGIQGPWVGWGHHHWLIEPADGGLAFVFKPHILHGRPEFQLPPEAHARLGEEERSLTLWWEGGFPATERIHLGTGELERWLQAGVAAHRPPARRRRLGRR